jgi:hypothetical protein
VNNPTLGDFCDTMIGRADIEESKSNVAMNAWLPQASYEGSLRQAIYIRGVVARRLGHDAQVAIAKGDPIYLEVSSSQRDLIAQLIPTNSESVIKLLSWLEIRTGISCLG